MAKKKETKQKTKPNTTHNKLAEPSTAEERKNKKQKQSIEKYISNNMEKIFLAQLLDAC